MKDDLFNRFKEQFALLQNEAVSIRESAESIIKEIEGGKFISSEAAERITSSLETYITELLAFRDAGQDLAIHVEAEIAPVGDAIADYENKQKMIAERQLVLDYLSLSTETDNVIAKLEESKRLLVEKCRTDNPKEHLLPFGLVVRNVKAHASYISEEDFDFIEASIGKHIARATDHGALYIDEAAELSPYLDGSCRLLMPIEVDTAAAKDVVPAEEPAETPAPIEYPEPETVSAVAVDAIPDSFTVLPVWDHYDGYIDSLPFEISDIPGIRFNGSEFVAANLLPKCFARALDSLSDAFSHRANLIKRHLFYTRKRTHGLNLFCIENNRDFPCVCWAEQTAGQEAETHIHYLVAGLFSKEKARQELASLQEMIHASAPAIITILVLSEDDAVKLSGALELSEQSRVRLEVVNAGEVMETQPAQESPVVPNEDPPVDEVIPVATEEPTTTEVPTMVKSLARIKDTKPSAASFIADLDRIRNPFEVRGILILVSYFGVIPDVAVTKIATIVFGRIDDEENREALDRDILKQLVSKNILTSYLCEDAGESYVLYCFTQYGYSCMHKDSVVQNIKRRTGQRTGNSRFIGKSEMRVDDLMFMCFRTVALSWLLASLYEYYDEITCRKIISSLSASEDNSLSFELPYKGDQTRFMILRPHEECSKANQLILADSSNVCDYDPNDSADVSLLFAQSKIYDWNGTSWDLLYGEGDEADNGADKSEMEKIGSVKSLVSPKPDTTAPLSQDKERLTLEAFETDAANTQEDFLSALIKTDQPSDEQFVQAIEHLIDMQTLEDAAKKNYSALANAVMLAKAASFNTSHVLSGDLYEKLLAGTKLPIGEFDYTGEELLSLFSGDNPEDEALKLAAFSYAMFAPQKEYDYTLDGACSQLVEDYAEVFPSYLKYKGLFIKLNGIRKTVPEGFSNRVIGLLGDQAERQAHANEIARKAGELLEVPLANTSGLPGHRETLIDCFGPDSILGIALKIIAEGKSQDRRDVEEVYQLFCKENGKISQSNIDAFIDEAWRKNRKHRTGFYAKARTQTDNAFWARLELIKAWLDADFDSSQLDANAIKSLRAGILREIEKALPQLRYVDQKSRPVLLYWVLQNIKARLELRPPMRTIHFFSGILFTGHISMADNGLPILDADMDGVKYYEPWRNVLKHIQSDSLSAEAIKDGIIFDAESPLHDNYRQLRMLGQYYKSDSDDYSVENEDLIRAQKAADAAEKRFLQELEYDYTYDRIGEADKERLSALLEYKERFYLREDFACWNAFLRALGLQAADITETRKEGLMHRLSNANAKMPDGESCQLLEETARLLEEKNYAVAEEYLNRFDSGERELSAETNLLRNEDQTFEEFISPEVFNPIFMECSKKAKKDSNFRTFAKNYISTRFPNGWTSRYKEDARDFVDNWPIAKSSTKEINIEVLLRLLGLDVKNVVKVKYSVKVDHYKATVGSTPRDKADYQHPISAFGTQIKNPLNVLVLYGKNDPSEIVTKVNSMNLGSNTIVFIDYPLALSDRRLVAEHFHKSTTGQNTFLLVDQVLALFLALKSSNERLPAFLKCTLPFTRYQPFVFDGGPTTDDMFCGRVSELQKILDPQGACVVYGGRQLGKTALLQRAESLRSKPADLHYAVYTNIIKMTSEKEAVAQIVEDIRKKTDLKIGEVGTIKDLVNQVNTLFKRGAVRSLLLLIDEADDFLDSISSDGYRQLQPFVDLKRETNNEFKFVLAGLHNVYRTKNATDRNGVFGQLGMPLCIKPLSPTDALQLISRPLMYLGFQVDRYPHLETILTNTNYYPGILQFFGYNLVQSVPSQYGEYFSANNGNPPFTLEEKQLSAIMTSNDLNNSIKEKFRLSLKLDARYFMLARVIAMLYFENDVPETSRDGFSAVQILDNAKDLGIYCLETCDHVSIVSLLDEMVEMGILNRVEQTKGYCLRRRSFLNIIGTDEDSLLDEIIAENKETE